MSYDIQVWSPTRPDLDALLATPGWTAAYNGRSFGGRAWQIVATEPDVVESEDVPDDVARTVPGITYLASLSLEPVSAPKAAVQLLRRTAMSIAKAVRGAVFDPQTDEIKLPPGLKRYAAAPRDERFSVLSLGWWFNESPLLSPEGPAMFVRALERLLPEALPKRYGLHEPPQHKLAQDGVDHLVSFLGEHGRELIVWYPSRPVVAVHLHLHDDWGLQPHIGWRSNHLEIEVEESALDQPGWERQLHRAWRELSLLVRPFYGEVRTRRGLLRSGGTYAVDGESDVGPVRGPLWRGIPIEPRHALVAGSLYSERWDSLTRSGQRHDDLLFLSKPRWSRDDDAARLAGRVPPTLLQKGSYGWSEETAGGNSLGGTSPGYAGDWPFER